MNKDIIIFELENAEVTKHDRLNYNILINGLKRDCLIAEEELQLARSRQQAAENYTHILKARELGILISPPRQSGWVNYIKLVQKMQVYYKELDINNHYSIAQLPNGVYTESISFQGNTAGCSYALGIFNQKFPTQELALQYIAEKGLNFFTKNKGKWKNHFKDLYEELTNKPKAVQLELFD